MVGGQDRSAKGEQACRGAVHRAAREWGRWWEAKGEDACRGAVHRGGHVGTMMVLWRTRTGITCRSAWLTWNGR
jgi:hypothetical protein